MLDARLSAGELGRKTLEFGLDRLRQRLLIRELRLEVLVAPAPEDEPAVRGLLPVIESVARVVRSWIQRLRQRLGDDHLAADRLDRPIELRQQAARVAVGGDHDVLGIDIVDGVDPRLFDDLGSGRDRASGEQPHPAGRLKRPVARVQDCAAEGPIQRRRQLVDPVGRDPVLSEGLVLGAERVQLLVVGQTKAPDTPERISGEPLHSLETALGEMPELRCRAAKPRPRLRIRDREPAQREAPVPAASARRDASRLEQAHAQPRLCECERTRATRDAAADHDDVRMPVTRHARERFRRLCQPVRLGHVCRDASSPGTHHLPRPRIRRAPVP